MYDFVYRGFGFVVFLLFFLCGGMVYFVWFVYVIFIGCFGVYIGDGVE